MNPPTSDPQVDSPAPADGAERLRRRDAAALRLQKGLAVAAGGAAVLFLISVYLPASTRLADLRRRISSDLDLLDSGEARAARLPEVDAASDALERSLAQFKPLPAEAGVTDFIGLVTDLAARLRLRDVNLEPGEPVPDAALARLPVKLSFGGDFADAFEFVRQLEALPRPLRVREFVARAPPGGAAVAAGRGEVAVSLTVNLYYRVAAAD